MIDYLAELREKCAARGVELVERPGGHCQIKGAAYTVNYYPMSRRRTCYIAGTTKGLQWVTPGQAVAIATGDNVSTKKLPKGKRAQNQRGRRMRVWNRGVRTCYWCGLPFKDFEETTLEHRIPLSRGGLDNANNHELAHKACNGSHGNAMPHVTRRRMEKQNAETRPAET